MWTVYLDVAHSDVDTVLGFQKLWDDWSEEERERRVSLVVVDTTDREYDHLHRKVPPEALGRPLAAYDASTRTWSVGGDALAVLSQ